MSVDRKQRASDQAQELARVLPQIVREIDGCFALEVELTITFAAITKPTETCSIFHPAFLSMNCSFFYSGVRGGWMLMNIDP